MYFVKETSVQLLQFSFQPENIICSKENQIKIIDFGTAKRLRPEKQVRAMCGTAEFLAPEIVNYDDITVASDMWAVGGDIYILDDVNICDSGRGDHLHPPLRLLPLPRRH